MNINRPIAVAAGLLAVLCSPAAAAQDPVANAAPTADEAAFDAFGGTAVTEATLGEVTGREDVATLSASSTQRAVVANNSVNGTSTTGDVRIDGNAFQNIQGLAVISANSGNNVAINSAMNVTINMAPR